MSPPDIGAAAGAAGPALQGRQLDLFLDSRDAFLVHEVVASLLARDPAQAERALRRVREEIPSHPDLPALALLVAELHPPPPPPATHAGLTAVIDGLQQSLAAAARRLLGPEDGATFLRPSWEALAAVAVALPFDAAYPRAHRSWLCQQCGDWTAVRAAVEADPGWDASALLRYRLGLAMFHLGDREAAIRLWLALCWLDPALFERYAATLPSPILREGWHAFEAAVPVEEWLDDKTDAACWFPAWLLLRHRALIHTFRGDAVPAAGTASHVFRLLLSLLRLEAQGLSDVVVRERRALQQLSPGFFRYYMDAVDGRESRVGERHHGR